MRELPENVVWASLAGPHEHLSCGTATARRYLRGLSPMCGFADAQHPDFEALAAYCEPGEHVFCGEWSGPVPPGWRMDAEIPAQQMIWDGRAPADDEEESAVQLGAEHVEQMLELVGLTQPGPFSPRTIEMGEYFGFFEDGQLVAMAGERLAVPGWREISGVCTHPDMQGRGLAHRLMTRLIGREIRRGETPFLHVMAHNSHAIGIYERMGFVRNRQSLIRAICRV